MKTRKIYYPLMLTKKRKNPDNDYEIVRKVKYYLDDSVPSTKEIAAPDFDEITTFDLYYNQTRVASMITIDEKALGNIC